MKKWFEIPNKVVLSNPYRPWGQWYKDNKVLSIAAWQYYVKSRKNPSYESVMKKYAVFYTKRKDFATITYYNPKLMTHMRKHLVEFPNFRTDFYTFFLAKWNPIYGDIDLSGIEIVHVERVLYERDRLLQVFQLCPEGSYGWYAYRGLRPVKFFVQSFAAAQIDQFFAACIMFLKQPFGPSVDNIMTAMETWYWNSREDFVDWAAGQLLGQRGRSNTVWLAAQVSSWLATQRTTSLPSGEELTQEQWNEIGELLIDVSSRMNNDVLDKLRGELSDLYDTMVVKNQSKDKKLWSQMEEPD